LKGKKNKKKSDFKELKICNQIINELNFLKDLKKGFRMYNKLNSLRQELLQVFFQICSVFVGHLNRKIKMKKKMIKDREVVLVIQKNN